MSMWTKEEQIKVYGVTEEQLIEDIDYAISKGIYIMGILSDAQYVLAHFEDKDLAMETARQYMNKVKFYMSRYGIKLDEYGRML